MLTEQETAGPSTKKQKLESDLIFKGNRLICENSVLLINGGFSIYCGSYKDRHGISKQAAISKIKVADCTDNWKTIMDRYENDDLHHECILSVFGYEDDPTNELRLFFIIVILFRSRK